MSDDSELLQRYLGGSQSAFTELVQRHLNHVYGAALRRMRGDRPGAEEVAQIVFTRCAQKAQSLRRHPALSAWLHQATRFAALDAMRRRFRTERLEWSLSMQPHLVSPPDPDATGTEIRPFIDAVLDRLSETDRSAVVLRFFEGLSMAQIGARLRISEDAARMRVERALEKSRAVLARRGIVSSAAALGSALAANGAVAAPAGLGASIALSAGATVTSGAVGIGGLFAMTKIQASVIGTVVALGVTGVIVEAHAIHRADGTIAAWRPNAVTPRVSPGLGPELPTTDGATAVELRRLRMRVAELKSRPEGVVDAELIPRSGWKNVGRATPEAALETFLWASSTHAYDELAKTFSFGERTKATADAFFASLPTAVQMRYGSAERLFVPYIFGMTPNTPGSGVEAIEPIEAVQGVHSDEVLVRYWIQTSSGTGQLAMIPARRFGDEWRIGSRAWGVELPHSPEFAHALVDGRAPETLTSIR